MSGPTDHRVVLDHDQQTVLQALQAVFGAEHVTVTDVQPTRRPDADPAPTQTRVWQATLPEEASCTSTCS